MQSFLQIVDLQGDLHLHLLHQRIAKQSFAFAEGFASANLLARRFARQRTCVALSKGHGFANRRFALQRTCTCKGMRRTRGSNLHATPLMQHLKPEALHQNHKPEAGVRASGLGGAYYLGGATRRFAIAWRRTRKEDSN